MKQTHVVGGRCEICALADDGRCLPTKLEKERLGVLAAEASDDFTDSGTKLINIQ